MTFRVMIWFFCCLLEIFPGDALLFSFLLQRFQGIQLHALAHLVQALDQIGVARNAEIFAFVEKKLLVDQVPENILFLGPIDLVGVVGVLLLDLVPKLVFAAA